MDHSANPGERSSERRLFLLCRAGGRLCALPLRHVVETMRPLPTEAIAGAPSFVKGISVIRGEAVPVVDVAHLLRGGEGRERGRFVVVRAGGRRIALEVESALGIRDLPSGVERELPPLLGEALGPPASALGALDGELLVVLGEARCVPESTWRLVDGAGGSR